MTTTEADGASREETMGTRERERIYRAIHDAIEEHTTWRVDFGDIELVACEAAVRLEGGDNRPDSGERESEAIDAIIQASADLSDAITALIDARAGYIPRADRPSSTEGREEWAGWSLANGLETLALDLERDKGWPHEINRPHIIGLLREAARRLRTTRTEQPSMPEWYENQVEDWTPTLYPQIVTALMKEDEGETYYLARWRSTDVVGFYGDGGTREEAGESLLSATEAMLEAYADREDGR